jgi:hypothetical protein
LLAEKAAVQQMLVHAEVRRKSSTLAQHTL